SMNAFSGPVLAIIALALLWLGIAAAIAFVAARRFALAEQVLGAARSNATLLQLTPARPLVVRPDGRIAADARVLPGPSLAPPPERTMLLWFFATSAGEEERARLALRLRQTEGALNSLTHLIEAAPFPMWYRGPDLKLGLVNSSFVDAVEGKDAADVIERCSELIDAEGEDSAIASARKAQETGHIVSRMQPAIIRGERRMLRIVNVPLTSGASGSPAPRRLSRKNGCCPTATICAWSRRRCPTAD